MFHFKKRLWMMHIYIITVYSGKMKHTYKIHWVLAANLALEFTVKVLCV